MDETSSETAGTIHLPHLNRQLSHAGNQVRSGNTASIDADAQEYPSCATTISTNGTGIVSQAAVWIVSGTGSAFHRMKLQYTKNAIPGKYQAAAFNRVRFATSPGPS